MIHLATGVFLFFLAYLVKFKQWSWLIAGYNTSSSEEKEKYDTLALCTAVGNLLFLLEGLCLIGAIGEIRQAPWLIILCWVLFTATSLGAISYLNTGGRFRKSR